MKRLLLAALLVPLAGCFGPPDVPDDATVTEGPQGLVLSSWTGMRGGRIEFHGVIENTGDEALDIRTGCGEPWTSTLVGPNGTVPYVQVLEEPGCAAYWDALRPGAHLTFLHSWNFRGHDPEAGESWTLSGGTYAWTLRFELRDDTTALETTIAIPVACSERNPCPEPTPEPTGNATA